MQGFAGNRFAFPGGCDRIKSEKRLPLPDTAAKRRESIRFGRMNGSFRNSKLHIFSSSATPDTRFTPAKGTQERLSGKFSTSDEVDRLTFIHPEENPVKIRGLDKPSRPKTDLPCNRGIFEHHCQSTDGPVNPITSRSSSASLKTATATASSSASTRKA